MLMKSRSSSPGRTRRRNRIFSMPPNSGSLPCVLLEAEQHDRPRLRQRLDLDHAREHRVPREVPREERLFARDPIARSDVTARRELLDRVDEAKRRTVRQQTDQGVGIGMRHDLVHPDQPDDGRGLVKNPETRLQRGDATLPGSSRSHWRHLQVTKPLTRCNHSGARRVGGSSPRNRLVTNSASESTRQEHGERRGHLPRSGNPGARHGDALA